MHDTIFLGPTVCATLVHALGACGAVGGLPATTLQEPHFAAHAVRRHVARA